MPKTNQMSELRKLSTVDLIKTGEEKRAELFALKFQAVLGSLEQTHRIKMLKREIARVEMVLGEKKAAGENTNQAVKADYSEAVKVADENGKKVREAQLKKIQEAYGMPTIDETGVDAAMKAAATQAEAELATEEVVEEAKPAKAPKPAAKKAAAKKPAATKAKPTPKKTDKGEDK